MGEGIKVYTKKKVKVEFTFAVGFMIISKYTNFFFKKLFYKKSSLIIGIQIGIQIITRNFRKYQAEIRHIAITLVFFL